VSAAEPIAPLFAAGAFLLIGAAILAWPRPLIRAYVRLVKPMRGLFGSLVDWEVGLLQSRTAPWLVRLFGLFVILSGASIIFFRITR
jgi:hypothetical protein